MSFATSTVGFYNLGVQQSMLDPDLQKRADYRMAKIAQDIADAFQNRSLDFLGLRELGEHTVGLNGRKHFGHLTQVRLMEAVVNTANDLYRARQVRNGGPVGAEDPLFLLSGDIASYALIARVGSSFNVDRIYDKGDLDRRPTFQGQGRMDRHMVVCEGARRTAGTQTQHWIVPLSCQQKVQVGRRRSPSSAPRNTKGCRRTRGRQWCWRAYCLDSGR